MTGHWAGYGAAGRFYRKCIDHGMTQSQTADAWGVSRAAVSKWAKLNGVSFPRKRLEG